MTLEDVRVTGRNTLGVIIWRDRDPDDFIASIACFQDTNPAPAEPDGEGPAAGPKRVRSRQNGKHPTNGAVSEE